jgi:hypothetical protein
LALCCTDGDKTFEYYLLFEKETREMEGSDHDLARQRRRIQANQASFTKANIDLDERRPFETQLETTHFSWEGVVNYLDFEKKSKHADKISHLRALYERIIDVYPFSLDFWMDYLAYMDTEVKVPSWCAALYERAVRHMPWASDIWCGRLRALERTAESVKEKMTSFFQLAMRVTTGFEENTIQDCIKLSLTYCEFLRRQVTADNHGEVKEFRSVVQESLTQLKTRFPTVQDDYCQLERFWAHVEVKTRNFIAMFFLFYRFCVR